MEYIFTFLEGIASFISPCLLPMLPIYIAYFAGKDEKNWGQAIRNATRICARFFTCIYLACCICQPIGKND